MKITYTWFLMTISHPGRARNQPTSDSVTIESKILPRVGDDVDILVTCTDGEEARVNGTVVGVRWIIRDDDYSVSVHVE